MTGLLRRMTTHLLSHSWMVFRCLVISSTPRSLAHSQKITVAAFAVGNPQAYQHQHTMTDWHPCDADVTKEILYLQPALTWHWKISKQIDETPRTAVTNHHEWNSLYEGTLFNVCSLPKHWETPWMKKFFYEAQSTTQTHYGVTFHMGTLWYILFFFLFFSLDGARWHLS